ncbi:MAG: glycoside-pentoside-hexuronide (GPH):cation symporter [Pseudomonadota bacterium]
MQQSDIGKGRIIGYGIGDFGFNLFYTGLNLYLLYYYTDILRIRPEIAGLIFMVPVIWDGITDPLMGWLASRTRTRWGRYRPYILFGAPIMALSYVAMFAAPLLFPGAIVLACALSHILFRTAYTIVSIPYTALSAAMTTNSGTRSSLAGVRMLAAILGGLFTAFVTLALAARIGGDNIAAGFVGVAWIYAGFVFFLMLIVFFATAEPKHAGIPTPSLTTAETARFLRSNQAFWILFLAIFAGSLGNSIGQKALVYYVAYIVGDPDAVGIILTATLGSAALSVPLWTFLARQHSKRTVWLIASSGSAAIALAQLLIGPTTVDALLPFQVVGGIFVGGFAVIFWAMLPDTVEFGEWHSGVRDEGIAFGLNQFALKAASGLGVGLLGLALGAIGYEAGSTQGEGTQFGIRLITFGAPLSMGCIALLAISFYPVSKDMHARLVRGLKWRALRRS